MDVSAFFTVNDRDRLAPVTLTREHPVAELVVDLRVTLAVFGEPADDLFLSLVDRKAVEHSGIDHCARRAVGEGFLLNVAALDDLDDREVEFLGEFPVA